MITLKLIINSNYLIKYTNIIIEPNYKKNSKHIDNDKKLRLVR